jgi:hypothetical protein
LFTQGSHQSSPIFADQANSVAVTCLGTLPRSLKDQSIFGSGGAANNILSFHAAQHPSCTIITSVYTLQRRAFVSGFAYIGYRIKSSHVDQIPRLKHCVGGIACGSGSAVVLLKPCAALGPGNKQPIPGSRGQMAVQESQKLVVTLLVIAAW